MLHFGELSQEEGVCSQRSRATMQFPDEHLYVAQFCLLEGTQADPSGTRENKQPPVEGSHVPIDFTQGFVDSHCVIFCFEMQFPVPSQALLVHKFEDAHTLPSFKGAGMHLPVLHDHEAHSPRV